MAGRVPGGYSDTSSPVSRICSNTARLPRGQTTSTPQPSTATVAPSGASAPRGGRVEAQPVAATPAARTGASWGLPSPADAEVLRGLPAIGRGIRGGAIKGTVPGAHLR